MQVLEALEVAPDHDQVHAPLVLDLEVAHGLPVGSDDAERVLGAGRGGDGGLVRDEAVAGLDDAQAGKVGRRARMGVVAAGRLMVGHRLGSGIVTDFRLVDRGVQLRPGKRRGREDHGQHHGEGSDSTDGAHAVEVRSISVMPWHLSVPLGGSGKRRLRRLRATSRFTFAVTVEANVRLG